MAFREVSLAVPGQAATLGALDPLQATISLQNPPELCCLPGAFTDSLTSAPAPHKKSLLQGCRSQGLLGLVMSAANPFPFLKPQGNVVDGTAAVLCRE